MGRANTLLKEIPNAVMLDQYGNPDSEPTLFLTCLDLRTTSADIRELGRSAALAVSGRPRVLRHSKDGFEARSSIGGGDAGS